MKIKIALVSLLTFYCFSAMIAPQQKMYTEGYQVGDEASGFSLKNASNTVNGIGENVGFNDYKNGKGYIIIFTCNHCPFAKAYEDRINALHKVYAPKGFPVIAINSNDTESVPEDSYANMKIRAKEKGFSFAYLHDPAQTTALTYGATKTPHVFLVEKKGDKNYIRYIGAIDDDTYNPDKVTEKYVENAVNDLLTGKKVEKNYTRAVGCTIKWKQ